MTSLPQPTIQLRRFPARAFNQPIVIRPASYTPTDQGGANPATPGGFGYMANVQPITGRANWQASAGGTGDMPESVTGYEIRLPFDAADPVINAVRIGDQIEWGTNILAAQGTANNVGGMNVIWLIRCEQVQS